MVRFFFSLCLSLLTVVSLFAQSDIRKQINEIKLDESFIKTEANDEQEDAAFKSAALNLIYNYNSERLGKNLDTLSIEVLKPALKSLVYARGEIKRVLVFIEVAVADSLSDTHEKENAAVAETKKEEIPVMNVGHISSYNEILLLLCDIEMVDEAVKLILSQKDEGKISEFGQLKSITDIPQDAYLIIYDRQRSVRAILAPQGTGYHNIKRDCDDAITNYSGSGAIWFR